MTRFDRIIRACPLCGDKDFKRLFSKDGLEFAKCRGCGLVYINPQPADDEISALYSEDYYKPWGLDTDSSVVSEMKITTFDDKLTMVERFIKKGRILDIGCATGFFLEAAMRRGWDAFGVEIVPYSAEIAQGRFGKDKVFNGELEAASYRDGFFDVVFMSDLVEHVKEIDAFFKEVSRIVKVGGIIAIVTPNIESLSYRLMRRSWPHLKMEHLYYFSPSTMKRLLEREGFNPVHISAATKALNLSYIERQASTYHRPVLTPVIKMLTALVPKNLKNWNFKVKSGEMLMIGERVTKNGK